MSVRYLFKKQTKEQRLIPSPPLLIQTRQWQHGNCLSRTRPSKTLLAVIWGAFFEFSIAFHSFTESTRNSNRVKLSRFNLAAHVTASSRQTSGFVTALPPARDTRQTDAPVVSFTESPKRRLIQNASAALVTDVWDFE
jgi:hypothetical protein